MKKYQQSIVSSAPAHEIETFLMELNSSCSDTEGCNIIIEKTWTETLGALRLQRTRVTFCGNTDKVNQSIKSFRLKFLSAGG